jgi:hypothetical protein
MAEHPAGFLPRPDAGTQEATTMNSQDIHPGHSYALAANEPGKPLRPVIALRAAGSFLIYAGPSGAEWAADMSRVAGPWDAHVAAATAAKAAATALRDSLACEASDAVEAGYCQLRVHVTMTIVQVTRATEQLLGAA